MDNFSSPLISFDKLVSILRSKGARTRSLTALAGPPAVGKSTLSRRLVTALNTQEPGSAAVLEMDGYHFDDWLLVPRGLRSRKGSPETFDVAGFAHMLKRLRDNVETEIAVPVFDRDLEIARAGAGIVPQIVRHLIVEGNYLLLDREPWRDLAPLFDMRIAIIADLEVLRQRLVARWRGKGLAQDEINAKVNNNDLVNANLVLTESQSPDFYLAVENRHRDRASAVGYEKN